MILNQIKKESSEKTKEEKEFILYSKEKKAECYNKQRRTVIVHCCSNSGNRRCKN